MSMAIICVDDGQVDGPHEVSVVRYYGGSSRGLCYQITTMNDDHKVSYAQLTEDELLRTVEVVLRLIGGEQKAKDYITMASSVLRAGRARDKLARAGMSPSIWPSGEVVISTSLDELHDTRHRLRDVLGSWSDKLVQVYPSLRSIMGFYEGPAPYHIVARAHPDKVPTEWLSDGCRVVKKPSEALAIVCDGEEGSE